MKKELENEKKNGCIRTKDEFVLKTYNGKKVTVRDLQLQVLEIMDEVHRVCVKNNIRYALIAGSALGIVNYKGFIPWDDDIDICVMKEDWEKFIEALKSQININNGVTYYTFMKELKKYQNQKDKSINIKTCHFILRTLGVNFKFYDLIELFKSINKLNSNQINIEELLNLIRGEINIKRKTSIENIFKMIDTEKIGKIKLEEIKSLYNCKMHPDAYIGFKKEEDIFKEFCYTFDIFCDFYNIHEYINCEQFIEYYKGISASILDDNYFDDIINGVWNISIVRSRNVDKIINNNLIINHKNDEIYGEELIIIF